jgi:hypothetical protein
MYKCSLRISNPHLADSGLQIRWNGLDKPFTEPPEPTSKCIQGGATAEIRLIERRNRMDWAFYLHGKFILDSIAILCISFCQLYIQPQVTCQLLMRHPHNCENI